MSGRVIPKRIEHAKRNLEACDFLRDKTDFYDWIVTTAFYTAAHYIMGAFFPMTVKVGEEVLLLKTFDDYKRYQTQERHAPNRPHDIRCQVLVEKAPELANSYRTIMNYCMTARYTDYKAISKDRADNIYFLMTKIRHECERLVASASAIKQ